MRYDLCCVIRHNIPDFNHSVVQQKNVISVVVNRKFSQIKLKFYQNSIGDFFIDHIK